MAGYPSGAVSSPDSTRPLRGAVLGLGMIGRHHARLLQTTHGVDEIHSPVIGIHPCRLWRRTRAANVL